MIDSLKRTVGGRPNPYDCIAGWLDIDEKLAIKSTYFVFAGQRRHPDDPKYVIESLASRLGEALKRGHEIALHSGIECREGRYLLESRKALEESIGFEIEGLRPHYLSATFPAYWSRAAETGFRYSSSLAYDDKIGFQYGIDLPFVPFDLKYNQAIKIVEFPIAIMDCGLIGFRPASSVELRNRAFDMIDKAERNGSLLVIDWHQRALYDIDYPGWGQLYIEIMEYLLQKKPYIDSLSDLADIFLA